MNQLFLGLHKQVQIPRKGFLLMDDEVPAIHNARIFDPLKHSFNPLDGIDEKKARRIAEVIYTAYPGGESTLTVRNGRIALAPALMRAKHFGKIEGSEEVESLKSDILFSPVLRRVFCEPANFFFKPNSRVLARINRAELGEFDAKVLTWMLMEWYPHQIVIPDFGFYAREVHASFLRENRLLAGVNTLSELPPKLRQLILLYEKHGSGCTYNDAVVLAEYARLQEHENRYNDFIDRVMR